MTHDGFILHDLGDGLAFFVGHLPDALVWSPDEFALAWDLHPEVRPTIFLHGRSIAIPRYQQAYGADYHFSGQTSRAMPVPELWQPLLDWTRQAVHPALNGLLLNWYDGPAHYIGPHRDSVKRMVAGAPIVTVSFGETRTFRLSNELEKRDFPAENGSVFVLPQATNAAWKHAVPKSARYKGRRISVTVRGLQASVLSGGTGSMREETLRNASTIAPWIMPISQPRSRQNQACPAAPIGRSARNMSGPSGPPIANVPNAHQKT
jgi:alkylated DNA repair dioxygenase AlkB